jgi:hypothetical protein
MKSLLEQSLAQEITLPQLVASLSKYSGDVAPDRLTALAGALEIFLRGIPRALAVATLLAKDPVCGRAVAFATGEILLYCFDEEDLLPERDFGVLGLVDDAYLVHVFVASLRFMYPHVDISLAGYQPPEERIFRLVRALLPAGVAEALDRTCDNLLRVAGALFTGSAHSPVATPELAPTLRVGQAILALGDRDA